MNTSKSFMDQFARARDDFEKMPARMQESAKMATLTYPSSRASESKSPPQPQQKKRS